MVLRTLIFAVLCAPCARASSPILFFSDLQSGPKTGGENNKGAYVCVFGEGFGATRGTSTISVGGGNADNYPVWGATWLWYQKACFQLGASVATGNIVMTVGGQSSNALPFTVRSAAIYFVDEVSGNNSNDGSFATPVKDVWYAKDFLLNSGAIAYLRSGTWSSLEPGFPTGAGDGVSVLTMDGYAGSSGSPLAIVGYPGETATIACDNGGALCINIRRANNSSSYWTFANLTLGGTFGTHYAIDYESVYTSDGMRWIGNDIGNSLAVIMVQQGAMNGVDILGNNFHTPWDLQTGANFSERGYSIYFGGYGTQQNIHMDWNRFNQDEGDCYGRVASSSTGNTVTWGSGCDFTGLVPGQRIVLGTTDSVVNGDNYAVATVTDSHHITVTSSPGNHSDITYVSGGNNGTKGIDIYGHLSGDVVKSWTISNNEFWNFCREAMLIGGSDGGTPIIPDTGTQLVSNNIVVHNGSCDAQFGYSALTIQSGYMQIYNNTFYHNGNSPRGAPTVDIDNQSVTSGVISNNTFTAPTDTTYYGACGGTNTTGYICVDGGGSTVQLSGSTNSFIGDSNGPTYLTGNLNATDPLFVNPTEDPSTADFHLQSGSTVKTGGTTLAIASPDKDGCPRPQGATYALGPYEVPVTCSAPPPPPSGSIFFPAHK